MTMNGRQAVNIDCVPPRLTLRGVHIQPAGGPHTPAISLSHTCYRVRVDPDDSAWCLSVVIVGDERNGEPPGQAMPGGLVARHLSHEIPIPNHTDTPLNVGRDF